MKIFLWLTVSGMTKITLPSQDLRFNLEFGSLNKYDNKMLLAKGISTK